MCCLICPIASFCLCFQMGERWLLLLLLAVVVIAVRGKNASEVCHNECASHRWVIVTIVLITIVIVML